MLCRSEDEYLALRVVAPWIYRIAQLKCDTRPRVAEALELLRTKKSIESVLLGKRLAWPVFGGGEKGDVEMITLCWYVAGLASK